MKEVSIRLSTIADVRDFISMATTFAGDIDLVSGRYTVDGKSIMGIFSLDLMSPITARVSGKDAEVLAAKLQERFKV